MFLWDWTTCKPGAMQLKQRRDEKKRKEFIGKFTNILSIRFRGIDPHRILDCRVGGDQDDLRRVTAALRTSKNVESGAVRHRQIGKNQRKRLNGTLDGIESLPVPGSLNYIVAISAK